MLPSALIASSVKCPFQSFASFLVVLFCFPPVRASISWIQISYQLCILEISSCSSCSWQFISEWDIYILMKFCFFTFSLCSLITFVSFVWNLCLTQGSKDFLLYFLLGLSHIRFYSKFVILLSQCFVYGVRFFLCLCLTVCPVSASGVKKTSLSPVSYVGTFVKKQLTHIYEWAYFWILFYSLILCFYYYVKKTWLWLF